MGPVVGALLSAAISGLFSIGATVAANKYNSPIAQLRRLRKAGLPMAYMYQGRVNTQSDVPKLSIDPDLGTVEQLQLHQQQPKVDADVKRIGAEVAKTAVETEILEGERDWLKDGKREWDSEGNLTYSRTNQQAMLDARLAEQRAVGFIRENEQELKRIAKEVEEKLFQSGVQEGVRLKELERIKQQISNLVKQNKLMNQLHSIRSLEAMINEEISDTIKNGSEFEKALFSLLMKLFRPQSSK